MATFSRLYPSTPRIVNPPYWQVFANPKSTPHSTPFAATLMGNSIWAKDNI
ncbi:MAG: hypothetical protein IJ897_05105 [Prevotella sp.]|nr:hypothetical protein [Prevotella sp.]